jgi:hypothetical protein
MLYQKQKTKYRNRYGQRKKERRFYFQGKSRHKQPCYTVQVIAVGKTYHRFRELVISNSGHLQQWQYSRDHAVFTASHRTLQPTFLWTSSDPYSSMVKFNRHKEEHLCGQTYYQRGQEAER